MSRRRTYSNDSFQPGQFMAVVGVNSQSNLRYYRSTDYGETWQAGDYFGFPDIVAQVKTTPDLKYITGGMTSLVMSSSTGVGSWEFDAQDISHLSSGRFIKIAMDPTGQFQAFKTSGHQRVALSTNFGITWKSFLLDETDSRYSNDVSINYSGLKQAICVKKNYYWWSENYGYGGNFNKITPGGSIGTYIYNFAMPPTSDLAKEFIRTDNGIYWRWAGDTWNKIWTQTNPASINTDGIGCLSVSDDGNYAISSLADARVVFWNTYNGTYYPTSNETDFGSNNAYASALSRDGYYALSAVSTNSGSQLYLWKQYGLVRAPVSGLDIEEYYCCIIV